MGGAANQCSQCDPGTYADYPAASQCAMCPPGANLIANTTAYVC